MIEMKRDAAYLDTKVTEVAARGTGAFSAAASSYGPDSPSYLEHQFAAKYQLLIVGINAIEVLIGAVTAAEAHTPFMGVIYQEDSGSAKVDQGAEAIA
jgi:hypothetical protein